MIRLISPSQLLLKPKLAAAAILLLSLILVGCDGGICGTGDGCPSSTDANLPESGSPPETDGTITPGGTTAGSTTAGAATDAGSTAAPTDSVINPNAVDVTNDFSTTQRSDALLRFVHADSQLNDNIVVTLNGNTANPLLPLPGLSYLQGVQSYTKIAAENNIRLDFFLAERFRADSKTIAAIINPARLSAGSITTVISRGAFEPSISPIDILPLVTESENATSNTRVRIVHAAKGFSVVGNTDVYLLADNQIVSQISATFSSLSYVASPVTEYQEITPGNYKLAITNTDDKTVIVENPVDLSFMAGQVLTIIVRDDQAGVAGSDISVLVVEDSNIEID